LLAEHHLLDIGRVGDHRDHHVRDLGQAGGIRRGAGAGIQQGLHRLRAARPDGQLVTGTQQVQRHWAPHDTQTDESDFH
jgi:hypothetical protein